MADECTLVTELQPPVMMTVSNASAIPKGSILMLTDPATVAVTTGDTDIVIGIAAAEKIANDGQIRMPVYLDGIFRGTAGAAGVTVGLNLITDTGTGSANELVVADGASEQLVGRSLETAADRETFLFRLAPFNFDMA